MKCWRCGSKDLEQMRNPKEDSAAIYCSECGAWQRWVKDAPEENEERLVTPAIYKHFKGKLYATMFTSVPSVIPKDSYIFKSIAEYFYAKHTESNKEIAVFKIKGSETWFHDEEIDNSKLVIYKALYDGTGAYARPVETFLGKTDKKRHPGATQEYRFEIVK